MKVQKGIAITPKNYPNHEIEDIDEAFIIARDLGEQAVFIFQWHDFNMDIIKMMLEKAKKNGLLPILGLSPTTLGENRKELDIPIDLRTEVGGNFSFKNSLIRDAFKKVALDLASLKPPFLCLATEINFLALQRLREFLHFAKLYKETYHEVKKVSPQTKVFVSFQWDWTRIVDEKEPKKVNEHSKVFDIFRPELDIIALTTYPAHFFESPSDLPRNYYSWVYKHVQMEDEILIMEVGWSTRGKGSEREQVEFINRLPELLKSVNVVGIDWALLHDVRLPEFDESLESVGLVSNDGKKKPSYDVFKELAV